MNVLTCSSSAGGIVRLFDLWGAHVIGGTEGAWAGVDVACAAATVGSGADLFAVFGGIAEDAGFFGHDLDCCCLSECGSFEWGVRRAVEVAMVVVVVVLPLLELVGH